MHEYYYSLTSMLHFSYIQFIYVFSKLIHNCFCYDFFYMQVKFILCIHYSLFNFFLYADIFSFFFQV